MSWVVVILRASPHPVVMGRTGFWTGPTEKPPPRVGSLTAPPVRPVMGGPHRVGLYRTQPGLSSTLFCRLTRSHGFRPPALPDSCEARWSNVPRLLLTLSSESCGSGEWRMLLVSALSLTCAFLCGPGGTVVCGWEFFSSRVWDNMWSPSLFQNLRMIAVQ